MHFANARRYFFAWRSPYVYWQHFLLPEPHHIKRSPRGKCEQYRYRSACAVMHSGQVVCYTSLYSECFCNWIGKALIRLHRITKGTLSHDADHVRSNLHFFIWCTSSVIESASFIKNREGSFVKSNTNKYGGFRTERSRWFKWTYSGEKIKYSQPFL